MPEATQAPPPLVHAAVPAPPGGPRAAPRPRWHGGQDIPDGLPIARSQAWLSVPDGRIVVLTDARGTWFLLPDGPGQDDDGAPAAVARVARQQAFRRRCLIPHQAAAPLGLGSADLDQARPALISTNALRAVPTGAPSAIDELPAERSSL